MFRYFFFANLIFALVITSCKPSPKSAAEYNDKIVNEISKVRIAQDSLGMAIVRFDGTDLQEKLNLFTMQVENSGAVIGAMENFDKKDDLKKAAQNLLNFYKSTAAQEFQSVAEIAKKTEKSEEDIEKAKSILQRIDPRQRAAIDNFSQAQHAFAKDYRIILEQQR